MVEVLEFTMYAAIDMAEVHEYAALLAETQEYAARNAEKEDTDWAGSPSVDMHIRTNAQQVKSAERMKE